MVPFSTLLSRELTTVSETGQTRRDWRTMLRRHWAPAAVAGIMLGGAVARLLGGRWGLPLELHADEWVIVEGAVDMARRGSLSPPFFFRPDHVEMQLSHLAYQVYGLFQGASVESLYIDRSAPFILMARTITAAFGVAMIALAYLIGKRFNQVIGVLAAFLVSFFPMYVDESHFATPDVPLTFALMVVILGCMRYLTVPSWGNLLLACFGVSMAIAIKYPGALGTIMIAITVITRAVPERAWRRIVLHGAASLAAVVVFLFAISPFLFTNLHEVLSTMTAQAGDKALGADGLGWFGNMTFYAETFATSGGLILLVCFALGVVWSVRLRLLQSLPLWLGAIYCVILSAIPLHWGRWGLPMYLTPLLIAPIGIYYSYQYLLDTKASRWLRWGAVALGALMAANLVAGSAAATARYRTQDTRAVATKYFASKGVIKARTVYEGYTPLAPRSAGSFFGAFKVVKGDRMVLNRDNYDRKKIRYVAVSSYMYARYQAEPRYAVKQRIYSRLDEQFPTLATFTPAKRGSATVLEVANIRNALDYIGQTARGGLAGPELKLYEFPADRR